MPHESPLAMMGSPQPRLQKARSPGRRLALILTPAVAVVALALGWVWIWYEAGAVTHRTLAGWVTREANAGRVYTCGEQSIGGFPFRLEAHCTDAAAQMKGYQPPFTVTAKSLVFTAQVFDPTLLIGQIVAPLAVADLGQAPSFAANWSQAEVRVRGRPPDPESFSFAIETPRLDRVGATATTMFSAKHVDLESRVVAGTAQNNPVIETTFHVVAAAAPALHPLAAQPVEAKADVVLRGLKNIAPKSWPDRWREVQAAGGSLEIKFLRIERPDSKIVGQGKLTINAQGKLDGLIQIAVVGIERLVPALGADRLLGRGIDQLTASANGSGQGLATLDRLAPGLGNAVRDTANATVVDNLKRMGQPTEVDKQPAIVLPLRLTDGTISLGILPLGVVPPLF